jgi:phasin family protein
MFNFDDTTRDNKEAIDTALKTCADAAKSVQAIATEAADYSKKSFDDTVAHVETLSSAKSLDAVFELQSNFAKSYYENFVAEATRIGEMYAGLAKSVYSPYQPAAPKAAAASKDSVSEAA